MRHGGLNELFFFHKTLPPIRIVLCGANSEEWLHVLCRSIIVNDMGINIVNEVFDVCQCLASCDKVRCGNA